MSGFESVLIARHGAYGDCIHVSHLPHLLKDHGYKKVGVSTGKKGANIFFGNPYVDQIHYCELMESTKKFGAFFYKSRLSAIGRNYDRVIDLNQIIEVNALPGQYQNEYYMDYGTRARMGSENYYDIATRAAEFPDLVGVYNGEIYFTRQEEDIVKKQLEKFKDKFKVLINLSGTSPHKLFIQSNEVIDLILDKYKDVVVFTTGNKEVEEFDSKRKEVVSIVGKKPFRQALCMTKFMDCVIGCESGLLCGSLCLGTPTIQLMTAASIKNHCLYGERDFSIQSPCRCSPCHRNPYDYYGCPMKNGLPRCIYFDINVIMNQVEKVYSLWNSKIVGIS